MAKQGIRVINPDSWETEYWRLRVKLIRASLWKLLRFWITRNEENLYND